MRASGGRIVLFFALMLANASKVGAKSPSTHQACHTHLILSDQVEITPESRGTQSTALVAHNAFDLKQTSGSAVTNQDIRWHSFPSLTVCRAGVQICLSTAPQLCYKQAVWYSRNKKKQQKKQQKKRRKSCLYPDAFRILHKAKP